MLNRRKTSFTNFEDEKVFDSPMTKQNKEDFSEFDDDMLSPTTNLDPLPIGGDTVPPMEKHGDLLKELTNFNPFIRDKVNGWLGLVWSEKEEKFKENPLVSPVMNIKCANWCIEFLKTYTRDNNIITNIGYEDYTNMYHDIVEVLWLNLTLRCDEFGLTCNGDIKRICVELEHAAILVLMGAGDGKYNKLLMETVNRTESVSSQMEQGQLAKKTGVLSGLKKLFDR